jgi:hypothetical protein
VVLTGKMMAGVWEIRENQQGRPDVVVTSLFKYHQYKKKTNGEGRKAQGI